MFLSGDAPTMMNHSSRDRPESANVSKNILQRSKMKLLRISIVIVSAFVICWAPYHFMIITFIFLKPDMQVRTVD